MSNTIEFTCQGCAQDIILDIADMPDNDPLCWVCRCIRLAPDMPAPEQARIRELSRKSSAS